MQKLNNIAKLFDPNILMKLGAKNSYNCQEDSKIPATMPTTTK